MTSDNARWSVVTTIFITLALSGPGQVDAGRPDPISVMLEGPALGFILDQNDHDVLREVELAGIRGRMIVRLTAAWEAVEKERGVYDWSRLQPVVERLADAGYLVTLCITGSNRIYMENGEPPTPTVSGAMEGWTAFARSAVRSFGQQVQVFEVWDRPTFAPEVYAFMLKQTSLAIRAEAQPLGFEPLVAQGAVRDGAAGWQQAVWGNDVAPYIDILPVVYDGGTGFIDDLMARSLSYPPAPAIWAYLERAEEQQQPSMRAAAEAIGSPATAVLAALAPDAETAMVQARWAAGLQKVLATGFAKAPMSAVGFTDGEGVPLEGAGLLGQFFSSEDFDALMIYDSSELLGRSEDVHIQIPSSFVRNARLIDPVTGRTLRSAVKTVEGRSGVRSVKMPVGSYPLMLVYQAGVVSPGLEVQQEELEIQRARGLTAEEIIARYRELQEIQEDMLERWTARVRAEFHYKIAQMGSSLDVAIESNYFWEKGKELEWEQTDYFLNGNRIGWKNIPELPLIQPEKVLTLPLDLTLDKTYRYRLQGEEAVDGRPAYVLQFEPHETRDDNLYSGRVWIDKETFRRLKLSVLQSDLEEPVLSNEELDFYREVEGPGGVTYHMIDRTDGQQLWTVGGRNLVVRKEIFFLSYDINPPVADFAARRDAAYASRNQMIRDTDRGMRYLERQDDGTREIKEGIDTRQWFAAAGAFKDNSSDGVTPLGGVNWFDFDFLGKDIQLNVLFAGVVAFVNASKPNLLDRKIDLTLDAVGVGLKFDDKIYENGEELLLERIRSRAQNATLRLGIPAGEHMKFTLSGGVTFREYFEDSDRLADQRGLEFRLPSDHTLLTGTVQAEYNRRGYSLTASYSSANRSKWEEWGLYDPELGSYVECAPGGGSCFAVDPVELNDSFSRWGATVFKEWYLPKFQKMKGEVNFLDGSDMDRFSRYGFSLFGEDRLNGFSGSGVRFDQGTLLRAGYSFNLFEAVQLNASVENARVKLHDDPAGSQSFTGIGLSGNVVGPWKTVISLSYGRSIKSDIPDLEGENEFLFFVFKLF